MSLIQPVKLSEMEIQFCEIVVRVKSHFKMEVNIIVFTVASVAKVSEIKEFTKPSRECCNLMIMCVVRHVGLA